MKPGLNTGPYLTYVRWLGEEYQSEDLWDVINWHLIVWCGLLPWVYHDLLGYTLTNNSLHNIYIYIFYLVGS